MKNKNSGESIDSLTAWRNFQSRHLGTISSGVATSPENITQERDI